MHSQVQNQGGDGNDERRGLWISIQTGLPWQEQHQSGGSLPSNTPEIVFEISFPDYRLIEVSSVGTDSDTLTGAISQMPTRSCTE